MKNGKHVFRDLMSRVMNNNTKTNQLISDEEAIRALQASEAKKQELCWAEINQVLEKHGYRGLTVDCNIRLVR